MTVLGELAPAGSGQIQVRRNSGLYGYERALKRVGFDPSRARMRRAVGACRPAGRGCGNPVGRQIPQISGLNDSKLLTALQRERLYVEITRKALAWAVVCIEPGSATGSACMWPTSWRFAGRCGDSMSRRMC